MKNFSEADQTKNANIITEGEHRDLVETGRENIKKMESQIESYIVTQLNIIITHLPIP